MICGWLRDVQKVDPRIESKNSIPLPILNCEKWD